MSTGIGVGIAGQVFSSNPGDSTPVYSNLYSVEFDGIDDYLTAASSPLLGSGGSGAWTISLWFNVSALTGDSQRLIDINPGEATARIQIYLDGSGNTIKIAGDFTDNYPTFTISAGVWYNVIYRFDGNQSGTNNVGYVINGTNTDDGSKSVKTYGDVGTFYVGTNSAGLTPFGGYIDELSIWNKELSDHECIELYNSGSPTDLAASTMAANLQNWWRMGDPNGTASFATIVDAKGPLDLTMTNMVAGNIQTNVP